MIKLPEISFIVTCYNLENYIVETLESIISQTYKNFEIIIVNDASTDNSLKKLEDFKKKFQEIKIVNNVKNLGQLGSFIEGLKLAKGEFVAAIDGDDVLFPNFADYHIRAHMASSIALTSCAMSEIDEKSTLLTAYASASPLERRNEISVTTNDNLLEEIIENNFPEKRNEFKLKILKVKKRFFSEWFWGPMSTGVMRKSVLDYVLKYKHPENWRKGADKFLFVFCHLMGGSAIIQTPLIAYRHQPSNLSSANPVFGDTKYHKPCTLKLYSGYNKRIRSDIFGFIWSNRKFFDENLNHFTTRRMLLRTIFSIYPDTMRRAFVSLFVK